MCLYSTASCTTPSVHTAMVVASGETAAAASGAPQQRPVKVELVGYANFKRHNPRSDRFGVHKFHHVEFWCADATNTFKRCVVVG